MKHILRKIHGNIQHTGKLTSRLSGPLEIRELKKRLERAIEREEYEEAVRLRDEIRALEAKRKR